VQQKNQLADQELKVTIAVTVSESDDAVDMKQFAKLAYGELGLGRNQIFALLRKMGFIDKFNEPYQRYVASGWFKVSEKVYSDHYGNLRVSVKTLILGKEQFELLKRLREAA